MADLHPAISRIHHGDFVAAWTNAETRTWDVEKIKAGVTASTGYRGAKIMFNVAKWPKWLSQGPTLSTAKEDEFAKLVGDLVRITRDIDFRVDYWEVPNEYERGYEKAGILDDLWRLWHKMAAEIRRVDPQALLRGGQISSAVADARASRANALTGTGILIRNSFRDLIASFVRWLPRLAGALLFIVIFWLLARLANMIASAGIGIVLQFTGSNYAPLLTVCSFAYLCALGTIHWLAPKLEPADVEAANVEVA